MPVAINGKNYYRTAEICRIVGISRSTFFRWLKSGLFPDAMNLDRRGWRLFTEEELKEFEEEAHRVRPNAPQL